MDDARKKILFIHNIMAPYRLPIFRQLAKTYDLKLLFTRITHTYRRWQIKEDDLEFNYIVSRGVDLFGARIPFDLLYELAKNKYDLVIVGESSVEMIPSCLISLFFKLAKHTKIILMSERFETRNTGVQYSLMKRAARTVFDAYLRFLYTRCDAFVACSSKAADYLVRYAGIEENKIFESLQAIFDVPQSPFKEVKPQGREGITILTVAYLEDRKGIDKLILAFRTTNNADARLIIAGDGEVRQKLEAIAFGYDNIVFMGYVDGAEKRNLYEAADIFVLPSLFETWGLVVNEAMHYGLPVIITDAMGSTDLIDGNGIIVPAGDTDALAQALRRLIQEEDLRKKMGKRSREIIRRVDLNVVTAPFMRAIGSI